MANIEVFKFLNDLSGNFKIECRFSNCEPVTVAQYKSIWLCGTCYRKLGKEYECFTDTPIRSDCEICDGKLEYHVCSLPIELIEQLAYGLL